MATKKRKRAERQGGDRPADLAGPGGPEAAEDTADGPGSRAPTVEQVIEALSAELEGLKDLEDRHLRLVAEFDNFRKRTAREREQQAERAQADLAKALLESLDDLARVSEHGSVDHDASSILEGVQLVESKLLRALEQKGLKRIEAVGRSFDPEVHEALMAIPTDEPDEDNVISQEIARGYMFRNTLLRPSLVEVKRYRPPAEAVGGDASGSEDGS